MQAYMYDKSKYSLQYGIKQLLNNHYSLVIAKLTIIENYHLINFGR